jgi:hypothetical protein
MQLIGQLVVFLILMALAAGAGMLAGLLLQ